MDKNAPLIEIKGIEKAYQIDGMKLPILKGIDLVIEQGEFVAIMGPSGSGKSTLMHILGLLDHPTGGEYRIAGEDVLSLTDSELAFVRSKIIGFVFQQFNLLSRMSALDNVTLPLIYTRTKNRQSIGEKFLKQVGLSDRLHHAPNQLSGGQQQRVAIARALVNGPRIIFADEPTGNLASSQAGEVMGILKELNEAGITVVMVTHEPDVAAWAKRVIHIKDGLMSSDEGRAHGEHRVPNLGRVRLRQESPWITPAELYEYFASAMRAMLTNKMRTFLTMLGVIIGVGAIIAMLALGAGAQKAMEQQLSSLGSNLLAVRPGSRRLHGVGGAAGQVSRLTIDDAKAIGASPFVGAIDPNVSGSVQAVYGPNNTNTRVEGVSAAYAKMHNAEPAHGRFFTEAENERMEKVAIIGQTVATTLFGQEDPLGKSMKIDRRNFKVIGLLPVKGSSRFQDQDDTIIIPLNTAMKRMLGKQYLNVIWLEAKNSAKVSLAETDARQIMRKRHRLPEGKDDDFEVMNMSDIQEVMASTTKTMTMLLGIIAGISLLVGGIGIMNIMLVSVSERTREIGLRKAIGATQFAVLAQFLLEASLLSIVGGGIGLSLGVGSAFILSKVAGWTVLISPSAVGLVVCFSAGVGIVFGFWPARKASMLAPIEALRYE